MPQKLHSLKRLFDTNPVSYTHLDVYKRQLVLSAPHATRISRLDETLAARKPVLRYTRPTSDKTQPKISTV